MLTFNIKKKLYSFLLILFTLYKFGHNIEVIIPDFSESKTHPLQKNIQYQELFSLYIKTNKKKYISKSEYDFRFKVFKKNLFMYIKKNESLRNKIYIKKDQNGNYRLYIIPDKSMISLLNEDMNNEPQDNSTQYELNKFSDMSDKEFDSIFSLDQRYFDDENFNEKDYEPKTNLLDNNLSTLNNYIQKVVKKNNSLLQINKKLVNFVESEVSSTSSGLNQTPYFSTKPEHNSKWTNSEDEHSDTMTKVKDFHHNFFNNLRVLEL